MFAKSTKPGVVWTKTFFEIINRPNKLRVIEL